MGDGIGGASVYALRGEDGHGSKKMDRKRNKRGVGFGDGSDCIISISVRT